MKIKKFNDYLGEKLSPDTYRSAASKLKSKHKNRSEELYKHARVYKGEETEPYTFKVSDAKPGGGNTFSCYFDGFSLYDRNGKISSEHHRYITRQLITSNSGITKDEMHISIIPKFIMTEESVNKSRDFSGNLSYSYKENNLSLFEVRIKTKLVYDEDGMINFYLDTTNVYCSGTILSKIINNNELFLFNNRKDAIRFKKLLVESLKPGGDMYEDINELIFREIYDDGYFVPSTVEILSKVVKEKLSLNDLYETN